MKNPGVRVEAGLVEAVTLEDKDGMRTGLDVTWCFLLIKSCFKNC